jgi:AcrR family transcriptional regulator
MTEARGDHRRLTAERNVDAIIDAAHALLERGAPSNISAVAREAGVSRVTVYAHFPTREALLEAVVERTVRRATRALDAAAPEEGPPAEALERVLAAAWGELDSNRAIARATAEGLGSAAVARSHEAAHRPIRELVERGRREGAFRADLPAGWLVTSCFALIHACGDEVRAGGLDRDEALAILTTTVRDVLAR